MKKWSGKMKISNFFCGLWVSKLINFVLVPILFVFHLYYFVLYPNTYHFSFPKKEIEKPRNWKKNEEKLSTYKKILCFLYFPNDISYIFCLCRAYSLLSWFSWFFHIFHVFCIYLQVFFTYLHVSWVFLLSFFED